MGEQTVRRVIRASVILSTLPLVLAWGFGRVELWRGSGTSDALMAYTGAVCLVAALPLWKPRRTTLLAFWGVGVFSAVSFVLFGNPYVYEHDQVQAMTYVLEVAQPLLMLLPVVTAVAVSMPAIDELRARRLRTVCGLAAAVAIGGQLVLVGNDSWTSLGFQLAATIVVAIMLWPAVVVARSPSVRHAWIWIGWMLVCALMAVQINRELPTDKGWRLNALFGSFGLLFALGLVVVPLVLLTTRTPSVAVVTARVVHEGSDERGPGLGT